MNKNSVSKLKLILMGIENRYTENKNIFKDITISYILGSKNIVSSAKLDGDDLKYSINNSIKTMSISELLSDISNEAKSYDSVSIIYCERGETVYITADDKNVTMKNKKNDEPLNVKNDTKNEIKYTTTSNSLPNKKSYLKIDECSNLLKELNILNNDMKIKNDKMKKYIELNEYIDILEDVLDDIPNNRIVNIIDCNCKNSYLLFVLNYYLTETKRRKCNFIGIDSSTSEIEKYKFIASNLNYRNMEFYDTDINSYKTKKEVNILISINNVGTELDSSIALGVKSSADVIVYLSNPALENCSKYTYSPLKPILNHKILKNKFGEVIIDGMRSLLLESKGYTLKINEYTPINENYKYLVTKAFKTSDENFDMLNEYMTLMGSLNIYPELYALLNEWD